MKRLTRDPARLESLNLLRQIEAQSETRPSESLSDPSRLARFFETVSGGLQRVFASASTLHGWLTQELFMSMIVALDQVQLVQELDAGGAYYNGAAIKLPDFLVATNDGERLLVEVKSCPGDPLRGFSLRKAEVAKLRRYAELTGGRLVVAIYWVRMNMWSVTDLRHFVTTGTSVRLDFREAMVHSEMGLLGDLLLATTAPLRLRLLATPETQSPLPPEGAGEVEFVTGAWEVWCGERRVRNTREQQLAIALMLYGQWRVEDQMLTQDGQLTGIEYVAAPEISAKDEGHDQEFDMIGSISEMLSTQFLAMTTREGEPYRLSAELDLGVLRRLLDREDRTSADLPLWKFTLVPGDRTAR